MDTTPSRPDNRSRGSELCTQCGLCCTGALHDRAILDADELAPANGMGLQIGTEPRPGFSLPCPKLAGTVCKLAELRRQVRVAAGLD